MASVSLRWMMRDWTAPLAQCISLMPGSNGFVHGEKRMEDFP